MRRRSRGRQPRSRLLRQQQQQPQGEVREAVTGGVVFVKESKNNVKQPGKGPKYFRTTRRGKGPENDKEKQPKVNLSTSSGGEMMRHTSQNEQPQRRQKEKRLLEKPRDEATKKESELEEEKEDGETQKGEIKRKEEGQWKWCKEKTKQNVEEGKERRKKNGRGEGKRGGTWQELKMVFHILVGVQHFGVDAASDHFQNRGRKLEDFRWEKEAYTGATCKHCQNR